MPRKVSTPGYMNDGKTKVLLVEDDPGDRDLLALSLREAGGEALALVFADRLSSALMRLDQGGIDVILMDLSLPDSFGLDSLVKVLTHAPRVPVIVLTGLDDDQMALESVKHGAQDYLVKGRPSPESILRCIRYSIERKRSEDAKLQLAAIVESIDDAITAETLDGKIISWNPGAEQIFGFSAQEMIGQNISILVPEDYRSDLEEIPRRLKGGECIKFFETARLRKDGTRINVSLTISPMKDASGRIAGASVIARDITRQKISERYRSVQYSVTRILAESNTLAELAPRLLESVCKILEWDVGVVWSVNREAAVLKCIDVWHNGVDSPPQFASVTRNSCRKLGAGILTQMWDDKGPIWVCNSGQDDRLEDTFGQEREFQSWFALPVKLGGEVLGIIEFFSNQRREPDHDLLELFSALASQLGQFLERKHKEEQLLESEALFKQLVENIHETFWISSPDASHYFYVSPAYEELSGRSCESLYKNPRSFLDAIHPEDRERLISALVQEEQDAEGFNDEYRLVRPDGSVRWIWIHNFPVVDESGRVYRMCGIAHDITDRKRAEEMALTSLRSEQKFAREIIEHAPVGIIRADTNFIVEEVNKVLSEEIGLSPDAIVGQNLFSVMPMLPQRLLTEALVEGVPFQAENYMMALANPTQKKQAYWDLALWPIRGEQKNVRGLVLLATDVTERVKLQQQREDFVATLTHDLKTPILGADRIFDLILEAKFGSLPSKLSELLALLKKNNLAQLQLIHNLLEVYRHESGAQALALEEFDLVALIQSCIAEVQAVAETQGLQLKCALPGREMEIIADRNGVRRVLLNLLSNAIKFTSSGGVVDVSAEKVIDTVVIRVRDTGKGILPEEQPHLFQRFSQGSLGRRYQAGTGLGLYLCRQIVEAHHGHISFESELGSGTTFTISLPVTSSCEALVV